MGKVGAPFGNQNAVKHGFYAKFLNENEKMEMKQAKVIKGLDDELALLRVRLCHLLENDPDRIDLLLKAVGMIARLSRTGYVITPQNKENLKDAIGNVLTEVAIPLGLKSIP